MRNFNPDDDIKPWARWIVGVDFGYGHPFAAALCAWVHDLEEFYVVDGFKMERSEAFYHVKRIASMCRGLRVPICWPHDGLQHEKGSGLPLADVYRRCGAPMLSKYAQNHGSDNYHTEPAIEEMIGYMKRGCFTIASHMSELGEEILSYHRDEDYKIVRLRDDLISAARYAFMSRRWVSRSMPVRATAARPASARLTCTIPAPRAATAVTRRNCQRAQLDLFTGT